MPTQASNSFADTKVARLVALCLAAFFAFVLISNYSDDFNRAFSDSPENGLPVTSAETTPEEAANPALAACLQQRIGDVDRMKEEGVLSESQYASFRSRAEELCFQQNPA